MIKMSNKKTGKVMTPPTLIAPTALGQMIELATLYEKQQRTDDKNPEEANIVTNLNFDNDTNTGTLAITFTYEKGIDGSGNPNIVVYDPVID